MKISPTTELPVGAVLGEDTTRAELFSSINTHEEPSDYWEFLKSLHRVVVSEFGGKSQSHFRVYEPTNEILIEIESNKRPSDFRDTLEELELDGFDDYPVDLCRFCKNRRVPKVTGGE